MTETSGTDPLEPLTEPERRLVAAAKVGTILTLSKDDTIRAVVVRALACGERDDWPVAPDGVRLRGGQLVGRLNCAERTISRPLWLDDADIPDEIALTNSQTRHLSFDGSRVSGFTAQGVRIEGCLFLNNATLKGVCDLSGAAITSQFSANGATFDNSNGDAINAQSSSMAALFLNNATLKGSCDVLGATITGQFSANDATFDNPSGHAINAQGSSMAALFLNNATLKGVCDVNSAAITGQFSANGATLDNPSSDAINAQDSSIAALFLNNATLRGACDVNGAVITGQFSANDATFDNPRGDAINAQASSIASLFLRNATLRGVCDVNSATISGAFAAEGATFDNPGGDAINAQASRIGAIVLRTAEADPPRPVKVVGTLGFVRATIEQHFEISGARLTGGPMGALQAPHVEARGRLILGYGTQVEGAVVLSGAEIRGCLDLTGSSLVSQAAAADLATHRIADASLWFTALDLSEAEVSQIVMPDPASRLYPDCARPRGIVDLSRARVGTLTDFASGWPDPVTLRGRSCPERLRDADGRDADHLVLDGFEYQHLDNPDGNAADGKPANVARLRWLRAQSCDDLFARLRPQPWRHLATVLAAQGYEEEARRIAIARRVAQRYASDTGHFARTVSWLLHLLSDYGFNPWKAMAWSGGVILLCAALYGMAAASYCTEFVPRCADGTVFVRTSSADFVPGISDEAPAMKKLAEHYPAFDPLAYSFDVFLPFFDIGTERFWRVNTTTWWGVALYYFTVLEQIAGALLISLIVTGFTGLLTRTET